MFGYNLFLLKLKTETENTVTNKLKNVDDIFWYEYCSSVESIKGLRFTVLNFFVSLLLFTPHYTLANACAFREFHTHQRNPQGRPTSVRCRQRGQVRNPRGRQPQSDFGVNSSFHKPISPSSPISLELPPMTPLFPLTHFTLFQFHSSPYLTPLFP